MKFRYIFSSHHRIFKFARGHYISTVLTNIVHNAQIYIIAYMAKLLLNAITIMINEKSLNWYFVEILILTAVFETIIQLIIKICATISSKSVLKYNIIRMNEHLDYLSNYDMSLFDTPKELNEIRQASRDKDCHLSIFDYSTKLLISMCSFLYSFIIAVRLDWIISILIILLSLPSLFAKKKIKKDKYEQEKSLNNYERQVSYYTNALLERDIFREIKIYGIKDFFIKKYASNATAANEEKYKLINKHLWIDIVLTIFFAIMNVLMNILVIAKIVVTNLTIGDFGYYSTILKSIKNSFITCSNEFSSICVESSRFENYEMFKSNRSELTSGSEHIEKSSLCFEFRDVSFKYPNEEKYVLKKVSFTIKNNEKLALAGLNGAGKSTIINLLLRLYDPTHGDILLNGTSIKEYSLEEYQKLFACVFQDLTIYPFTFKENVLLPSILNDECKINDVVYSMQKVGFSDPVPLLDKNMSKRFDPSGEVLSYGQGQKICLARAICKQSPVYIMDEPSASLDPKSEFDIFNSVFDITKEKTLILVSHRLSNIKSMDTILFFEDGELLEKGNHSELMQLDGKYANLYRMQAIGYN